MFSGEKNLKSKELKINRYVLDKGEDTKCLER